MAAIAKLDQLVSGRGKVSPVVGQGKGRSVSPASAPLPSQRKGDDLVKVDEIIMKTLAHVEREMGVVCGEAEGRGVVRGEEIEARGEIYDWFYSTAAEVKYENSVKSARREMGLAMVEIEGLRRTLKDVVESVAILPAGETPEGVALLDALSKAEQRETLLTAELQVAQNVIKTQQKQIPHPGHAPIPHPPPSLASELRLLSTKAATTTPTRSPSEQSSPTTITQPAAFETGVLPASTSEIWMPAARPSTNDTGSFVPASAIGAVWDE